MNLSGSARWGVWRYVRLLATNGVFLPLLVILIAFAARFHHLGTQSLWNDEGNSLRLAQRSVGDLIDAAGRDIHPPGYYLALKGWIALLSRIAPLPIWRQASSGIRSFPASS